MQTRFVKYTRIGLIVWVLLQTSRLIAIPLINDVLNGVTTGAWLYPAILDVVVAVMAPFTAFLLWKKKGLFVWTFAVVFFVVSIIDHGDAVTASYIAELPKVFKEMGADNASGPPMFQTLIDIVGLFILCNQQIRNHYLN